MAESLGFPFDDKQLVSEFLVNSFSNDRYL